MRNVKVSAVILYAGVFALFFFKPGGDVHWPQWLAYATMAIGFVSLKLKITKSLKIFLVYTSIQSVIWAFYRPLTAPLSYADAVTLRFVALEALIRIALSGTIFFWWRETRSIISWALFIGGLLQVCSLSIDQPILHLISGKDAIGLLGNRSIGASFVAVWIFFVLEWSKDFHYGLKRPILWSIPLALLAVCVSNSSISFIAMAVGMSCYLLWRNTKVWTVFGVLGMVVSPFAAPRLLDNNSRFEAWPMFFDYWFGRLTKPSGVPIWGSYWEGGHFPILFGSGAGSFQIWGPTAQIEANFMKERWFLWAHNDWLQIGFEYGLIGFLLALWVYADALRGAFKRPALFAGAICLGITMFGNYPLEIAATNLLAWWIFAECFSENWGRKHKWTDTP